MHIIKIKKYLKLEQKEHLHREAAGAIAMLSSLLQYEAVQVVLIRWIYVNM